MKIFSSELLRRRPGEFWRLTFSALALMGFVMIGNGAVAGPKAAHCNAIDDDDQRALCKALSTKSGFFLFGH